MGRESCRCVGSCSHPMDHSRGHGIRDMAPEEQVGMWKEQGAPKEALRSSGYSRAERSSWGKSQWRDREWDLSLVLGL